MKKGMQICGLFHVIAVTVASVHNYSDIDLTFRFEDLDHDLTGLRRVVGCALDRVPCDETTLHYKVHIREVVRDTCLECDPRLKHNIRVFLQVLKKHFPGDYRLFRAKYDPDGTGFGRVETEVAKY